jgi:hypothetical protein
LLRLVVAVLVHLFVVIVVTQAASRSDRQTSDCGSKVNTIPFVCFLAGDSGHQNSHVGQ